MKKEETKPYVPSEEAKTILNGYRLLDDDFMKIFFDQNFEATELMLRIILNRNDIVVKTINSQKVEISPLLGGRNIVLDIFAVDSENKNYDIEIQRADRGAGRRRARFHSAVLDSRMLETNDAFSKLCDSYVIFITENDVLKKGLPIYHINRHIEELGNERFDDGNHIIYVNGAYKNNRSNIGKLMNDFRSTSSENMFYGVLKDGMRHYKETEGGRTEMCKAIEKYGNEQRLEGKSEGKIEEKIETAKRLIAKGKSSLEDIAETTELPLEQVKEIAQLMRS